METKSITYRILKKAVTVFLLAGMLLPSALQAKHLVDFCMMEMMNHHQSMDSSHDCCLAVANHHSGTEESNPLDCENGRICACPVNEAPAQTQSVVPVNSAAGIILSQTGFNFSLTSPDEIIHKDLTPASNQYPPPLYLLYDTFLN